VLHCSAMRRSWLILGLSITLIAGCDHSDRIAHLERQNAQLQEKLTTQQTIAEYDLREKCSRDAKSWFKENWSRDKDTILLDYTDHYSKEQNKCFILVEYHYKFGDGESWVNNMTLWDVQENSKYGFFSENHAIFTKPEYRSNNQVILCEVLGKECKTGEEFNRLISPYL
jgi:hypothetical protein